MTLADEFAAIAKAAFIAGALSETKKLATKAGKETVRTTAKGVSKAAAGGVKVAKRTPSAYSKAYGKAFKRLAPRYKKKGGGWKKNGFKLAQKAAHKEVKGSTKKGQVRKTARRAYMK